MVRAKNPHFLRLLKQHEGAQICIFFVSKYHSISQQRQRKNWDYGGVHPLQGYSPHHRPHPSLLFEQHLPLTRAALVMAAGVVRQVVLEDSNHQQIAPAGRPCRRGTDGSWD